MEQSVMSGNSVSAAADRAARTQDRRLCALAAGILFVAYLFLQTPFWVPGPDTPFYIGLARSLATKFEYTFNGHWVAKTPPLWPMALAGAMKISPAFAFLNLLPMACMLASAAMWYWILRRFAPPRRAFQVVLLTGLLFWWHCSTTQLRSEPLFCVLFSGAVLLALQVSEGRASWLRIMLLAALCLGMVETRYAGLVAWFAVGGAIISGCAAPPRRQWAALVITGVVTAGAFWTTTWLLTEVLPPVVEETGAEGIVPRGLESADNAGEEPAIVAMIPSGRSAWTYIAQALSAGQWVAGMLWMPTHVAVSSPAIALAVNILGWLLIAVAAAAVRRFPGRRGWLLVGAALYAMAIIVRWSGSNPRYLMPIAPLLIIGVWSGFGAIAAASRGFAASASRAAAGLFVASLAVCNGALYAVEAGIARSGRLYDLYYGGEAGGLVSIGHYLSERGARDGEIAVSQTYLNLNRVRPNGFGLRGLVLLTDRGVCVIPTAKAQRKKPGTQPATRRAVARPATPAAEAKRRLLAVIDRIGDGAPSPAVIDYAREKAALTKSPPVRYYVYRPPVSPWRAWHFRVPWLQRLVTGARDIPENPCWELYEIRGDELVKIDFPAVHDWPRRVPGI